MTRFAATPDFSARQRHDSDHDHAGANHVEVFRNPARHVDDAFAMFRVHAVIDLDDGTTVVVHPPNSQHGTQWKAVAGCGKEIDVKCVAGRSLAPLKTGAIKTGMSVEPGSTPVNQVGLSERLGRRTTMGAIWRLNPF